MAATEKPPMWCRDTCKAVFAAAFIRAIDDVDDDLYCAPHAPDVDQAVTIGALILREGAKEMFAMVQALGDTGANILPVGAKRFPIPFSPSSYLTYLCFDDGKLTFKSIMEAFLILCAFRSGQFASPAWRPEDPTLDFLVIGKIAMCMEQLIVEGSNFSQASEEDRLKWRVDQFTAISPRVREVDIKYGAPEMLDGIAKSCREKQVVHPDAVLMINLGFFPENLVVYEGGDDALALVPDATFAAPLVGFKAPKEFKDIGNICAVLPPVEDWCKALMRMIQSAKESASHAAATDS